MFELTKLRTDPEKVNKGAWMDYRGGARMCIAMYGNRQMTAFQQMAAIQHADIFQNLSENVEEANRIAEEIEVEALARFVLIDLEGFSMGGEPLIYTPELGIQILGNPEYAEFREYVERAAKNMANYRVQAEAAAAKAVKTAAVS